MLSKQMNERITQTGPGTPLGEAFRRYWMPALLSEEIPAPDCPPVRVGLLSEKLVAFRDSNGQVGLVAENCPHRGASLFFGRNEEAGLRCVYHGWKFDAAGTCVDMPNEPPESNFKHKVRVTAYPCVERGGVVWAYMGPAEKRPPDPDYEWARLPAGHTFCSKTYQECNYLQSMEGGIDSSHSSFLHRMFQTESANSAATFGTTGYRARSTAPRLVVLRTDFGFTYASIRNVKDEGKNFVRAYQWVMPFQQMRAYAGFAGVPSVHGHMWVPIDDETSWVYNWMYHIDGSELPEDEIYHEEKFFGRAHDDLIPGTYKPIANKSNDYLIDRERQRSVNFTGINGVNAQDMAVQESMGPIYDRTKEHLGSADLAIITARRMLLEAAKDVEDGRDPVGTGDAGYSVRAAEMLMAEELNWHEAMQGELIAKL
ncbi:MAG TPA: Rieske 2Fe-2S domain-containing protein [Chloroflexota bacterium]|jgi:phenylpropionate dioxygenase-like ring-hydroxylating dioxygenase large terminal subunit|nr:Rieske 2Fe-2S domain-containing protein [Chloroflexota bacterium]